uniref:Uncharacterized protein n=1 Tax=Arundo donax TaxID=35708 RepID=A0A0A9EJJ5_ARUDO
MADNIVWYSCIFCWYGLNLLRNIWTMPMIKLVIFLGRDYVLTGSRSVFHSIK